VAGKFVNQSLVAEINHVHVPLAVRDGNCKQQSVTLLPSNKVSHSTMQHAASSLTQRISLEVIHCKRRDAHAVHLHVMHAHERAVEPAAAFDTEMWRQLQCRTS